VNGGETAKVTGEAVGLSVASVEAYVTRPQLAELMGVSVGTVDNMVREGMPSVTWGRRTRRFRPSTAIAWAQARTMRAA